MDRRFDRLWAAVAEKHALTSMKLIALGVSSKVVVIIEEQEASVGSGGLAVKISGRQTTDAGSDHDQIVGLVVSNGFGPFFAIAQGMGNLPRAVMAAAHSRLGGGAVSGI